MILVDTSVWIDHFRHADAKLSALLEAGQVLTHPFVVGELALGSFNSRRRKTILQAIGNLPHVDVLVDDDVLHFIERHALANQGIGYVDAHLLAASHEGGVSLWTRDKRLQIVSGLLRIAMRI